MRKDIFVKTAAGGVLMICFLFYAERLSAEESASGMASTAENSSAAEETAANAEPEVPAFQQCLNAADELSAKQDYDGALNKLQEAKALDPGNAGVIRRIVDLYFAKGDEDGARNALIEMLKTDGFQGMREWAHMKYYELAQRKEGISEAVKKLEEAVGSDTGNVPARESIAEGYVRLRDWGKAAEIYEALLANNPGDHVIFTRFVDLTMANRDYEKAVTLLEEKVKASPTDTGASDTLCHAYVGAGKQKEAVNLYEQKIANDPDSPGLAGTYAQALMDFGMDDEALAQYRRAFTLDSSNLFFKQKAGEILLRQGKTAEAKREFEELIALVPASQPWFAETAKSYLKSIEEPERQK
ncbi:MAG: tetratricopeptide repeat protein [Candidatus Omnitrophica bacterium]|nr:tetratricopeptide repeat protein [Candidatus Omnitrophota bacterium]